jgi:hypothetical protein
MRTVTSPCRWMTTLARSQKAGISIASAPIRCSRSCVASCSSSSSDVHRRSAADSLPQPPFSSAVACSYRRWRIFCARHATRARTRGKSLPPSPPGDETSSRGNPPCTECRCRRASARGTCRLHVRECSEFHTPRRLDSSSSWRAARLVDGRELVDSW